MGWPNEYLPNAFAIKEAPLLLNLGCIIMLLNNSKSYTSQPTNCICASNGSTNTSMGTLGNILIALDIKFANKNSDAGAM